MQFLILFQMENVYFLIQQKIHYYDMRVVMVVKIKTVRFYLHTAT